MSWLTFAPLPRTYCLRYYSTTVADSAHTGQFTRRKLMVTWQLTLLTLNIFGSCLHSSAQAPLPPPPSLFLLIPQQTGLLPSLSPSLTIDAPLQPMLGLPGSCAAPRASRFPQLKRQAAPRPLVGLHCLHPLPLLLIAFTSDIIPLARSKTSNFGVDGGAAEGRLEGQARRRVRRSRVPRRGRGSVDVLSLPEWHRS